MISAVHALLCVLALSQSASAFRFGFGRLSHAFGYTRVVMRSAPKSVSSLYYEAAEKLEASGFLRVSRSIDLACFQMPINATVFPAIDTSPFLIAKYPDLLNRTVQNILSGLSDVTDIEYLNTLPADDPRRHLLATIEDPGPKRRAELMKNLQAIDAERGEVAQKESTYSVY